MAEHKCEFPEPNRRGQTFECPVCYASWQLLYGDEFVHDGDPTELAWYRHGHNVPESVKVRGDVVWQEIKSLLRDEGTRCALVAYHQVIEHAINNVRILCESAELPRTAVVVTEAWNSLNWIMQPLLEAPDVIKD